MAGWIVLPAKLQEGVQGVLRVLLAGHFRGRVGGSVVNTLVPKVFLQGRADNFFFLLSPKFIFGQVSNKRSVEGKSYPVLATGATFVDVVNIKNVNRRVVIVRIKMDDDVGFRMKAGVLDSLKLRNYAGSERIVARKI